MKLEKKILLIGGTGTLGSELIRLAPWIKSTSRSKKGHLILDLNNISSVNALAFLERPEVVVFSGGQFSFNFIKNSPREAFEVNVLATLEAIKIFLGVGSKIVFISSESVFDGEHAPYSEIDLPLPIFEYGRQKYFIEQAIQSLASSDRFLVLRIPKIFGAEGCFLKNHMRELLAGNNVRAAVDAISTPIHVTDVSMRILKFIEIESIGIRHIPGPEILSRSNIVQKISDGLSMIGIDASRNVIPCKLQDIHEARGLPRNTALHSIHDSENRDGKTVFEEVFGLVNSLPPESYLN